MYRCTQTQTLSRQESSQVIHELIKVEQILKSNNKEQVSFFNTDMHLMAFWKFFHLPASLSATLQEEPLWPTVFSILRDTEFSNKIE